MTDLLELFIDQEAPLEGASDQALHSSTASIRSRVLARGAEQAGHTLLVTAPVGLDLTTEGRQQRMAAFHDPGGMIIGGLVVDTRTSALIGARITLQQRVEGVEQPAPFLMQVPHHGRAGILVRDDERLSAVHRAFAPIAAASFGTYVSRLASTCDVNDVRAALGPIGARVAMALLHAKDEIFEYGIESQLAQILSALIADYGVVAVSAIGDALASQVATDETASETLRHLGAANDAQTLGDRIRVLAQQLRSESPRRRYAAAVGLADTNTPEAIDLLRKAIEHEPTEDLRNRFQRLITLLCP
jgi:hypothetical protein